MSYTSIHLDRVSAIRGTFRQLPGEDTYVLSTAVRNEGEHWEEVTIFFKKPHHARELVNQLHQSIKELRNDRACDACGQLSAIDDMTLFEGEQLLCSECMHRIEIAADEMSEPALD